MSTASRAATAVTILGKRTHWYGRLAAGRARRAARMTLANIGLPLLREFLVFDCAHGEDASGLFSEVAAVIGCLAEVEAHPELYAGLRVDFQDHGLYYEAAAGPNWWEYFFEPLNIGSPASPRRLVADWEHDAFAESVERRLARAQAAELLRRHVRVKRALLCDADRYWAAHAAGAPVIGVHYRGTDKAEEATRVSFDAVVSAVQQLAHAVAADWKLFVATDEQACVEHLRAVFPRRVIARDLHRSTNGLPIHKPQVNRYQGGVDAVIDCVLLSRSAHLVRTPSNLGLVSTFFNPDLPVTLLGTPP